MTQDMSRLVNRAYLRTIDQIKIGMLRIVKHFGDYRFRSLPGMRTSWRHAPGWGTILGSCFAIDLPGHT